MKDPIITSEDNLVETVFSEWISRLEWGREHEGEYYINPH
jgi:hypothetical protein